MKNILFVATLFSLSVCIISCQKSSPPSVSDVNASINPVSFITIENATDSASLTHLSFSKGGYTAIIQQNKSKDSSAIDSIKFLFEDATKLFPGTTPNPTYNTIVDTVTLVAPQPVATKVVSAYPSLVTQYYTFPIDTDSTLVTGKTYTVIATIYTDKGNTATTTFASLFKW